MADEITVSCGLKCANGGYSFDRRISSVKADQAAIGANGGVQEIGTVAHEAIAVGDIATEGYAIVKNIDSTNFVDVGIDVSSVFYPVIRLKAGEPCVFRVSTQALYAKADTAAVKIEFTILED